MSIGVIMTLAAWLLSKGIAGVFLGYDEEARVLTRQVLRICSLRFLIYGFNIFVSSYYTGLQKGTISAILAFLESLIMPVLSILILPELFGIHLIWFTLPAASLVTAVVSALLLVKKSQLSDFCSQK